MIGKEQVDAGVVFKISSASAPELRLDDAVSEILEHHHGAHRDQRVIIDHQDCRRRRVPRPASGWSVVCLLRRVVVGDRQISSAVVPTPTSLVKRKVPPDWTAKPWIIDRPSPVPLPTPLVEKKGSIARFNVVSSMPQPVSATRRRR